MSMSVLSTDLGYYGDSGAEIMKTQLPDVHPINEDVAFCCLNDPEQSQSQGGLPCTSAPHYSYLYIKYNNGYRMHLETYASRNIVTSNRSDEVM